LVKIISQKEKNFHQPKLSNTDLLFKFRLENETNLSSIRKFKETYTRAKVKKKIFQNFLELIKEEQLHDKVGLGR
jgi:hypothetical protein